MPDERVVHVIDDDEAVRDSLEFLLTTAGIEVRTYESAKAFLDMLDNDRRRAASSPTCACRR
jgi:two-component system, LuxR family, response regulator FixJ